jgi:hypothetical protein
MYDMWTDAFAARGSGPPGPPPEAGGCEAPPVTAGLGLMQRHRPHLTDWSLLAWMRRLGLVAGARFADLESGIRTALRDVPAAVQQAIQQALPRVTKVVNGWQMNIDTPRRGRTGTPTGCPRPGGPLGVTMRLYSPKASVLAGSRAPPAVRRLLLSARY